MAIALGSSHFIEQRNRHLPRISQKGNITDARKSSFLVSKKVLTLFFFALIQALGYIGSDFVTLETQLLFWGYLI